MHIPELNSPEYQAFVWGFLLPFISSAFGFAISVVRKILHNVNENN